MQFLNPAAFYLLGAIPIVVFLHFLKLRRYTYLVPSIMHWLSTDEDRRANVPFQRLRNILLPLLQVLFLLLLTCSVARPTLRRPGFMPGKAILIVDNSASMLSEESGQTRLSLAKAAALEQVAQISAGSGIMLMVTQETGTYIQQAFTTDTAQLQRAIENITPIHAPRNLRPVFDAVTRYTDSPQDQVFFISDTFENLPDIPLTLHKIPVGADAENMGIILFSVDIVQDQYEILVGIQNFTQTSSEFNVQLAVENAPLDDRTISIPSETTQSVLFSGDPRGLAGKVIRVHLGIADDFSLDNSVSAILPGISPLKILLVNDNQKSLLPELLRAYGSHVDLDVVLPTDYHGTGDADIAVFDGSTPAGRETFSGAFEVTSRARLIFINPGSNLPFVQVSDASAVKSSSGSTRVIRADAAHPLMADVSLQGLQVRESVYRDLPIWGYSLVETEKGSLIWLGNPGADTQLLVFEFDAFNPEISTFAVSIPGPLFVYQCLAWFEAGVAPLQPLGSQTRRTRHAFKTGEQVVIALENTDMPFRIQKPDETMVTVNNTVFTETDLVGVYTLFAHDGRELERFTVNLLDTATSTLSQSRTIKADAENISTSLETGLQPMAQEVWRFPAVLALIVLFVEWWFYHRERL
ncbi:MAG: BatA and WFA domain-containing protein [Candidatus Poribacteria bacterium]|nr:BatA and WFA domain-containing protein [Candidatus Poribacteria bacterium]